MSDVATQSVDSIAHNRMQQKIARDEKELDELLKGVSEPDQQEEPEVEVKAEPVAEKVEDPEPATAEERTFKKRYGDVRRHLAEKEQEHKEQIQKLNAQLSSAAKNELVLPKTDAEIEAWTKKYPDASAIFNTIADKRATEKSKELDRRVKEIEEMRDQAIFDKAESQLTIFHPDWESIKESDDFHLWAKEQPKWVQDALYENRDDAKSVSRVVDLYKGDKGIKIKKDSSSDKDAASSVRTARTSTPEVDETKNYLRESEVEKMTAKQYAKHADEIMEAIRTQKFIYDVKK